MLQIPNKQTEATPVVEVLYQKIQPRSRKGLLETLYEEVAKEYFQTIIKEAHGECIVKIGSKKNYRTGKIDDEWRVCALNQVGKGKTFAHAVLTLYAAIVNGKAKEGGVL